MVVLLKALALIALVMIMMKLFPSKAVKRNQNLPKMPIEGVGGWLLFFLIIFSLLGVTQLLTAMIDLGTSRMENAHIAFFPYLNAATTLLLKIGPQLPANESAALFSKLIASIPAMQVFDINEAVPSYLRTRAAISGIGSVITCITLFILGFRQKHSTIKLVIILLLLGRGGAFLLQAVLPYLIEIPASRAAFDCLLSLRQFAFTAVLVAIFALYMYKSKRVRNTYLKPGELPPRPIMPQQNNEDSKTK